MDREDQLTTAIMNALYRLNGLYGRGDVESFSMNPDKCTGTAVIKPLGCKAYTRKFRLQNDTVYYAGHQQKIKAG